MGQKYKVWLEVSRKAVRENIKAIRSLLEKKTKLFAVVKSNAYGHGLVLFSRLADEYGVDGFCVDSVVEGLTLRSVLRSASAISAQEGKNGIKKPILVLGHTLPHLYKIAAENDITVTISNKEALRALICSKSIPHFHIKIDTGMHRQGFYLNDLSKMIQQMIKARSAKRTGNAQCAIRDKFTGIYTHFAMAKDCSDRAFTDEQNAVFKKAIALFEQAGFIGLIKHAAATGGALLGRQFHYDAVRVGIGLYGIWPSEELEKQLGKKIVLQPALQWHAIISEIKMVAKGKRMGYDLTERARKIMRLAIIPIGYWHGLPRASSSIGFVYVTRARARTSLRLRRARIVGRVSMDMTMIDVTNVPCRVGTVVDIVPHELARTLQASPYEIITRINPLIYKKVI